MAEEQSQEQKGEAETGTRGQTRQERRKRSDPRRKRTVRLIIIAVLVVAIIVAIPVYSYYSVRESTDDAQVDGHVIPISPRISGNVLSVLINDNQGVGQARSLFGSIPPIIKWPLLRRRRELSSSEADTLESEQSVPVTNITTSGQISTSVTQEQQARASVTAAEKGVEAARARLNSANAALDQRQANFVKAQKDLARFKSLVDKDEISKQDYDAAIAAADANAAQVTSGTRRDSRGAAHAGSGSGAGGRGESPTGDCRRSTPPKRAVAITAASRNCRTLSKCQSYCQTEASGSGPGQAESGIHHSEGTASTE